MIELNHLTYSYNKRSEAVVDVTASIEPGLQLLLGENGAGKTTLLHLMAGLLYPTAGQVLIDGENPARRDPETLRRIFLLTEDMRFPADTINDFAAVHSTFYPRFSNDRFNQNLADLGLTGNEKLDDQSLGNRKKAHLAYALALGVDMLLLDEPTNGLDITSRKVLRHMLARSMDDNSTIIIATHSVADLDSLFDGVIVLNHAHLTLAMPSWQIVERLSFIDSPIPAVSPIYEEQETGVFHSIIINTSGEMTDVSYPLLYSALLSPARDYLLNQLNTDNQNERL